MSDALGRLPYPPLDLGPDANPLQSYLDSVSQLHGLTSVLRRLPEPTAAPVGTEAVQSVSMPGQLFDPLVAVPPGQAPITRSQMDEVHGQRQAAMDFGTMLALGMVGNAPGGGGGNVLRAYHGTPHTFEPTPRNPLGEFSLAHIGTGEGAQAYGHGVPYLAENERVARDYRDALAPEPAFDFGESGPGRVSVDMAKEAARDFLLEHPALEHVDENIIQMASDSVVKEMASGKSADAIRAELAAQPVQAGFHEAANAALDFMAEAKPTHLPTVGGEVFNGDDPIHKAAWYLDRNGGDLARTKERLAGELKEVTDRAEEMGATGTRPFESAADRIRKIQAVLDEHGTDLPAYKAPGHILEVEVNAHPEHFLHWDKRLSDQSPYVQERVQEAMKAGRMPLDSKTGKPAYYLGNPTGSEVYQALSGMSPARGSELLRDAGIPGLRYEDAGSRGKMGPWMKYVADLNDDIAYYNAQLRPDAPNPLSKDDRAEMKLGLLRAQKQLEKLKADKPDVSHNLVIFDPSTVNIIRRYGIPGVMTAGAAAGAAQQEQ